MLSHDGIVRWTGDPVAKLVPGDKLFEPSLRLVADDSLAGPHREKVEARLTAWLKAHVVRLLGPLTEIESAADLTGLSRGIGYQIVEALGVLERAKVAHEMRSLDQDGRANLRRHGVRFGAYHIFLPALLKPAPRTLAAQLWALKNGGLDQRGLDEIAHLASSGRTSIKVDPEIAKGLYRAAGFRVCGERAVRVDILERLADLIRPAIAYRPGTTPGEPPPGTADGEGFVATVNMTSLVGCSGEDFASILKSLGYQPETRQGPAITVPLVPAAARAPAQVTAPTAEGNTDQAASESSPGEVQDTPPAESDQAEVAAKSDTGETATTEEADAQPDATAPASSETSEAAASASAEPDPQAPAAPVGDEAVSQATESVDAETSAESASEAVQPAPAASSEPVAPAPTEAASSESASDETASVETTPAEATPAEPETVEIWKLVRHQRQPNHRGRHQGRAPEAAGEGRPNEQRRDRFVPGQGRLRGDRPEGGHGAKAEGGERRDGRPDRGRPRPDRRDERRGGGHGDQRPAQARPPRERQPDPDSPFAKLAALKSRLESEAGKR